MYTKGDLSGPNDSDIFEQQIDDLDSDPTWYGKIIVYGNTVAETDFITNKILTALNSEEEV